MIMKYSDKTNSLTLQIYSQYATDSIKTLLNIIFFQRFCEGGDERRPEPLRERRLRAIDVAGGAPQAPKVRVIILKLHRFQ